MTLSDDIIQQFRAVSLVRIDAIEAAWAQVLTALSEEAATQLHREIHTLKGESGFVGFADVNLVCHKLEDLVEHARERGYAVDEDFDLAVNMALRFMVMLIRKKIGQAAAGIDLPGFVKHIDTILKRNEQVGRSRSGSVPPTLRTNLSTRLSESLRTKLGPAAVDAFIEYAVAHPPRRDRLRASWHLLRDLIGIQRAIVSSSLLGKYKPPALGLGHELGKEVDIVFEVGTAEVTSEVLAAVEVAVLHLLRNAIDHGIEAPDVRVAAGKPRTGTIRLYGGLRDDEFVLAVEDDGAGIDFARVQQRATELRLIPEGAIVEDDRLVEIMCHPGFSTRTTVNEVSGRGVGLDAVRGGAVDLGGWLTARTELRRGTTWTLTIPVPTLAVHSHVIRAPGLRFPVIIDPSWQPLPRAPELPIVVDLGVALGMAPSNSISRTMSWFSNGDLQVGFACGDRPAVVEARRLITTPRTSIGEIATVDSVEGLLVRPDRIPGVVPPK